MATIPAVPITRDGITPTLTAADVAGDQFLNTGREFVVIDNADAGAHVVTLVLAVPVDGQNLAACSKTVNVPAGERRYIGPFTSAYTNTADGLASITYDGVTSVTVGVFQLVPAPVGG